MTLGPVLFARYAYPPNVLGYCGPDRSGELYERAVAGDDSGELRVIAQGFEGAYPYLELIAHANGLDDPLAAEVVEAYWVGNRLLDAVSPRMLYDSVVDWFRPRLTTSDWAGMGEAFSAEARPHHGFHVFSVYPWVGLLRGGRVDEPLHVLDRCRIRWGRVVEAADGVALVSSRPLTWDGLGLGLGDEIVESVRYAPHGRTSRPAHGDWCSLHWDWMCDVLTPVQLRALHDQTARQLAVANAPLRSAPAQVLA